MAAEAARLIITPLGLLSYSLKRELGVRHNNQSKLDAAIKVAIEDVKKFMRESHKTDHCVAMVLDGDNLRFISVQRAS